MEIRIYLQHRGQEKEILLLQRYNGGVGCFPDEVIAKSVAESESFHDHLEFCWVESAGKRQRLARTYDIWKVK